METAAAELRRLALIIQRILDAETVTDAEGAVLVSETEAARESVAACDKPAAREHLEQLVLRAEELVRSDAIALTEGRAVIQAADRILRLLIGASA